MYRLIVWKEQEKKRTGEEEKRKCNENSQKGLTTQTKGERTKQRDYGRDTCRCGLWEEPEGEEVRWKGLMRKVKCWVLQRGGER